MGVPGPGGPCSEILNDRGPEYGRRRAATRLDAEPRTATWRSGTSSSCRTSCSAVRAKEDFDIVGPLPKKNIDTGMGLERVAYLLQGVDNMYEIDEMFPVIERAAELSGRRYGADHDDDVRLRVVADHVRSALMLISDGVTPGQRGAAATCCAGCCAARSARCGCSASRTRCCPSCCRSAATRWARSYPELDRDWERISTVAYAEEDAFRQTLRAGHPDLRHGGRRDQASGGRRSCSGRQAFPLHDTYGFPIDLTLEMAAEQGLAVDEEGFRRLMTEQRERAKADARAKKGQHARRHGLPRGRRRHRRARGVHRLRRGGHRGAGPRHRRRRRRGRRRPARATRSSWSSTAPRSTPRAAASSPTRA